MMSGGQVFVRCCCDHRAQAISATSSSFGLFSPFKQLPRRQSRSYSLSKETRDAAIGHQPTTVLFSNIYPDSSASAAGVRTRFLLESLAQDVEFGPIRYATGAAPREKDPRQVDITQELNEHEIDVSYVPLNDSTKIDKYLQSMEQESMDMAVFDRFYTEEAYSFAIRQAYPEAALILDMQDMHSLRSGRQKIAKEWSKHNHHEHSCQDPLECLSDVMAYRPSADDPHLLRELASIHRSDLTLVCSPFELDLLTNIYQIPKSKVCLNSFFVPPPPVTILSEGNKESNHEFVFCGGFRHDPNVDAVHILLALWPRIRSELPTATLHIHGAYCPASISQCHKPAEGIHIHGFTESLQDIFQPRRILLAPLRFGAGIKGKIIDAWRAGMPVVTTPIGSEGMTLADDDEFGGVVASTLDDFCHGIVDLATNPQLFQQEQQKACKVLSQLFVHNDDASDHRWKAVRDRLMNVRLHLKERRTSDYMQAMLWHSTARSTEYFSKWIELKEKNRRKDPK